jgi:hypothetical protein
MDDVTFLPSTLNVYLDGVPTRVSYCPSSMSFGKRFGSSDTKSYSKYSLFFGRTNNIYVHQGMKFIISEYK